jgi:hypothetical protein
MSAKRRDEQAISLWVPVYLLDLAEKLRPRLDGAIRNAVLRAALVEGLRALEREHPAKSRAPKRPTDDELRAAEDAQVLEVLTLRPATVGVLAGSMLTYETSRTSDGGSIRIDWGDMPLAERRARIRAALERLRDAGVARVEPGSRRWARADATGCVCCAADEDRPLRLTLTSETARRLFYIVEKHEGRAARGVEGDRMVFVDSDALVAELVAREATRLRRGGRLPRVRAVRVKRLSRPPKARGRGRGPRG